MPETPKHPDSQLAAIETVTALAAEYWPRHPHADDHQLGHFRRVLEALRCHVESANAQDARIGTAFVKRCDDFDHVDPALIGRTIRCALAELGAEITYTALPVAAEFERENLR